MLFRLQQLPALTLAGGLGIVPHARFDPAARGAALPWAAIAAIVLAVDIFSEISDRSLEADSAQPGPAA